MPRAPKKCGRSGCDTRVTGRTYCDEHNVGWVDNGGRTATAGHKARRAQVLARDKGVCQIKGPRCTYRATICDHILNVARGGTDDLSNLQAVCDNCHKDKTQAEAKWGRTHG
jgi:5-methylcytosine-specific restriction protein A